MDLSRRFLFKLSKTFYNYDYRTIAYHILQIMLMDNSSCDILADAIKELILKETNKDKSDGS